MRRAGAALMCAGLPALGACLLAPGPAFAAVRVDIETAAGPIVAEVDTARAPRTACNFLRYVGAGAYDRGRFFRTVRSDAPVFNPVPIDVVQAEARGGEEFDAYGPIPLERTSQTGLSHRAGALSMARDAADSATSSFSIVVLDSPEMDFGGRRNPDGQGFAVFGRVVEGLDRVRRIQLAAAEQERLRQPVGIVRAAVSARDAAAARAACGG